jgi:hypothetical protein
MGESQQGQVPLHRTRQGLMPPRQILAMWFQVAFLGNPYRGNLDGYMPAHMEGREGNLSGRDSDTKLEGVGSPR